MMTTGNGPADEDEAEVVVEEDEEEETEDRAGWEFKPLRAADGRVPRPRH